MLKIVPKDYWTIAMVKSVIKFHIRVCRVVYTKEFLSFSDMSS